MVIALYLQSSNPIQSGFFWKRHDEGVYSRVPAHVFCVMQGNAKYKYYLMGLLTGLSFWMQQDSLITLVPFLFYSFYSSAESLPVRLRQKALGMTAGFITISIPLILYFTSHQSLSYLWEDAFLFNLHAPGNHSGIIEKIRNCKHALHEVEFEMPFYTALILGTASLFLKNRKPMLLRMSILTLFLSFSAELLSGRMKPGNSFVYYLLPLAATIPILVYVVFNETQASFLQDKRAQLIFSVMLGTTLLLGTLRYSSGFRFSGNRNVRFPDTLGMDYLKTQSLSDDQLFVFDDSNFIYLYNYFGILSPSRWFISISGVGAPAGMQIIRFSIPYLRICRFIKHGLYWIVLSQETVSETDRYMATGRNFWTTIIRWWQKIV